MTGRCSLLPYVLKTYVFTFLKMVKLLKTTFSYADARMRLSRFVRRRAEDTLKRTVKVLVAGVCAEYRERRGSMPDSMAFSESLLAAVETTILSASGEYFTLFAIRAQEGTFITCSGDKIEDQVSNEIGLTPCDGVSLTPIEQINLSFSGDDLKNSLRSFIMRDLKPTLATNCPEFKWLYDICI